MIESYIDDMNPEIFGYLMEKLQDDGAVDICWIPCFMKKNRPGTKIEIICRKENQDRIIDRIFSESTTIGVRYYKTKRKILDRQLINIKTSFGMIQAKKIVEPDGFCRLTPEYDVCKEIATEKGVPLKRVYDEIIKSKIK